MIRGTERSLACRILREMLTLLAMCFQQTACFTERTYTSEPNDVTSRSGPLSFIDDSPVSSTGWFWPTLVGIILFSLLVLLGVMTCVSRSHLLSGSPPQSSNSTQDIVENEVHADSPPSYDTLWIIEGCFYNQSAAQSPGSLLSSGSQSLLRLDYDEEEQPPPSYASLASTFHVNLEPALAHEVQRDFK